MAYFSEKFFPPTSESHIIVFVRRSTIREVRILHLLETFQDG